jgi:hypothetical protein
MKMPAIAAAAVVCLALSACAGTPSKSGYVRRGDGELDLVKVIGVNQWARNRHASVLWVNYPVKSKASKDAEKDG